MTYRKITSFLVFLSITGGMAVNASALHSSDTDDVDTVVVTANRIPTKKIETAAAVSVITSQQIEDNHYTSIGEVLQQVNGVVVSESTPGTLDLLRINGDDRVVVLVDGRRMNSDMGTGYGRSNINLATFPSIQNIDRIEVVRGNGSALYGSDAVGGVVNIITKKGKKNQSTLDVNTGSWGTQSYTLTNEGVHDKTSWFVSAGYDKRNYLKYNGADGNAKLDNTDFKDNTLTMRVDQQLSNNSSLRFDYDHKTFDGKLPGTISYPSPTALQRLTNNWAVTYNFKENSDTPAYIRYYDNYMTTFNESRFTSRTKGVDVQNTWNISSNQKVTGGLEWRESNSSNLSRGYSDVVIINQGAYAEDIIKLNKKLTVTPGIRLDNNSRFGFHKTPKIALNYAAGAATNFFASWGRVFSAPQVEDMFYNVYYSAYGYGMYGNPNLKPETGYSETIGMNHNFDDKTSLSVSLFKSEIHDAIRWYADAYYNWYAGNLNNEKKSGIDITFKKKINTVWNYDLGYSYINTETDTGNGAGLTADIKNSQPNGYHAGLHYAKNAWKANLLMTAGTGRNTTVYSHSSYVIWDGSVSYDAAKNTTIYFKMNNITNRQYETYASGYGIGDYPMPGRYFQLGVKYTF